MIPPSALRGLGTWKETPWEYPMGRTGLQAEATKRFTWEALGTTALTGEELHLAYYTQHRVLISRMEDLAYVAAREAEAIALLERPVRLATEGVGFIPPVHPFPFLHAAACGAVQAWIDQGGYPDQWQDQMAQALTIGNAEYVARMGWAKRVGAEPERDPVLATFGWRVKIKPLELPLVVLA